MLAGSNSNICSCNHNHNPPFVQLGKCIVPFCRHGNECKKNNQNKYKIPIKSTYLIKKFRKCVYVVYFCIFLKHFSKKFT